MSWLGRNVLGSSKLPARIVTISGAEPGSPNRGDPQSPQNARVVACPLSAGSSKYFGLPWDTTKAAFPTPKTGTKALPDSRLQSRQRQVRGERGGAVQVVTNAPPAQPPH